MYLHVISVGFCSRNLEGTLEDRFTADKLAKLYSIFTVLRFA